MVFVQGLDVQFLKELQLPVMEPIMSNKITLSLYDWDAVGYDFATILSALRAVMACESPMDTEYFSE